MNKGIVRAAKLIASAPNPPAIIIVFEHSDPEPLVEKTNFFEYLPSHRDTKHSEHVYWNNSSVILARILRCPGLDLTRVCIADSDFCVVRDGVRDRTNETDSMILFKVPDQSR